VLHEVARLQQFAITLRSKDAPADALVFMGRLVRGGNAIALRWLETLWVRRNGACVCCFLCVCLPASGRSSASAHACADASRVRSTLSCCTPRRAHAGMKMFFIFTLNGAQLRSVLAHAHAHGAAATLTPAFSRLVMRAQCRTST
jgi:hypothetical protein